MTIRKQLTLTVLLIAAIAILPGLVALTSLRKLDKAYETVTQETMPALVRLETLSALVGQMQVEARSAALASAGVAPESGPSSPTPHGQERLRAAKASFDQEGEAARGIMEDAEETARLEELIALGGGIYESCLRVVEESAGGAPRSRVGALIQDLQAEEGRFSHLVEEAIHNEAVELKASHARIHGIVRVIQTLAIAMAIASVLLCVGVSAVLARRIARPLAGLRDATLRLGGGDLSARSEIHTGDEIGDLSRAINYMAGQQEHDQALLLKQRDWLDVTLSSIGDAVIATDTGGKVVFLNAAAAELTAWTQEAMGRHIDEVLPLTPAKSATAEGDDAAGAEKSAGRATGETGRWTLKRRDGKTVPVAMRASPIQRAGGDRHGVVFVLHDMTERLQTESTLRGAKDAAEAATRARSEFLANMSHEVRTPLNAIVGMTGLLLDGSLSDDQREFASTIRTSCDSLLTIINDILDFSKIESGRLDLEQQGFDIRDCVESALDLVAPRAAEKRIDLCYHIDEAVPAAVLGDVTRVRQVLANLLANAVKFTDQGEVDVRVEAAPGGTPDDGPREIHFSVRDTGIGIPDDAMPRLFRSFTQVDASTTRHFGGSGLGLAICKHLTGLMGGRIWVESKPGIGSTFHFTIRAATAPSRPLVYPKGPDPSLAGKRLLVVDDNETNRKILVRQTEAWGLVARAAKSGQEAIEWARRGDAFDVAILDMNMPEMDGLTLAKALRELRSEEELPFVMLTSLGEHESPREGVQFTALLTRPVKPAMLHGALLAVFGGTPAARPRPAEQSLDASLGERKPLRILLAEDNTINQKVAVRILERLGYRADVAANGIEAVEALRRQRYDVVFMDVQMPEMDGLAATREICRLWPRASRPRLVAMTASAMEGDREDCLSAGMDDYISKPVDPETVQRVLENLGGAHAVPLPPAA